MARQIPEDIVRAARRAGLRRPLWYVGPLVDPDKPRKKTLADIAEEAREKTAQRKAQSDPSPRPQESK